MVTRRSVLVPLLFGPLLPRLLLSETQSPLSPVLTALETRSRGRLGCAIIDLSKMEKPASCMGHRENERFPMCSTFKFLVTALILKRADADQEHMDHRVSYTRADLLSYAPVTQQHVNEGMTVAQLCEAAMTMSDNTAANLLLTRVGGPAAVNAFLRSIGDNITRLDRTEPTLNEAAPGDERDTTTPAAMAQNLNRILFGNVLNFSCRALLTNWLMANKTGDTRIRAGLPHTWKVGDRTGSGEHGTTNDIAAIWPPRRAPILVTAYLTQSSLDDNGRNAILADIGRAITNTFSAS